LTVGPRFCGGPHGPSALARCDTQMSHPPYPPGRGDVKYRLKSSLEIAAKKSPLVELTVAMFTGADQSENRCARAGTAATMEAQRPKRSTRWNLIMSSFLSCCQMGLAMQQDCTAGASGCNGRAKAMGWAERPGGKAHRRLTFDRVNSPARRGLVRGTCRRPRESSQRPGSARSARRCPLPEPPRSS
jgi:hypothetical protein